MIGTREAQPIGQLVPRFFMPITIKISKPMRFDRYAERKDDPLVLRQITDEIMFELRELSGQDYVNTYAKRKDHEDVDVEPAKVATIDGNGSTTAVVADTAGAAQAG